MLSPEHENNRCQKPQWSNCGCGCGLPRQPPARRWSFHGPFNINNTRYYPETKYLSGFRARAATLPPPEPRRKYLLSRETKNILRSSAAWYCLYSPSISSVCQQPVIKRCTYFTVRGWGPTLYYQQLTAAPTGGERSPDRVFAFNNSRERHHF